MPREPFYDGEPMTRSQVFLPQELKEKAKRIALRLKLTDDQNRALSAGVREALKAYDEKEGKNE